MSTQPADAADLARGEQIYTQQCAKCHGKTGEGNVEHYANPLIGDRSVLELAKIIGKTMPEDKPASCTGEDAEAVAAFIHHAFYSPVAQARAKPARIELARVTVRQYQNMLADLIGSYREPAVWPQSGGLKARYFRQRGYNAPDQRIERVDPVVDFDFGDGPPRLEVTAEERAAVEQVRADVNQNWKDRLNPKKVPDPEKAEWDKGEKEKQKKYQEGKEKLDRDRIDPEEFSIRWEGSVLAPETGDYQFVVRTDKTARLWVNNLREPLVDAWVKSGTDTEYRGSVFLIGGRAYAIKLEFSKPRRQGEKKKNEIPPPHAAMIGLEWKVPHRTREVIPAGFLSPERTPEVFVVQTKFPPDDRSVGYERANSISKAWDQATTAAAIEASDYVLANIDGLIDLRGADRGEGGRGEGRRRGRDRQRPSEKSDNKPADTKQDDNKQAEEKAAAEAAKQEAEAKAAEVKADRRAQQLRQFAATFAERAFRRPLSDAQRSLYIDRIFDASDDPELALRRVVLLVLKSPRFLYRELSSEEASQDAMDSYDVAARLSIALWDSLPDAELLRAASKGELTTLPAVRKQAERMLADRRARAKLHEFFCIWLHIEHITDLSKDSHKYPEFTPRIATDLRDSLLHFVDDTVWSEQSDFRQLLLADALPLNGRLAEFLKVKMPADSPFQPMPLSNHRAGVLTHPYLLAAFAYTGSSSPIHRGVFISRNMLGRALRPPPIAVSPIPPDLHADLTTRERVSLQTQAQSCMSCHTMINGLGFTLENFDAVGRFREKDNGRPVITAGDYQTRTGDEVRFKDVQELAKFLANSQESHTAFVEQLFHFMIKQPIRAHGEQLSGELTTSFRDSSLHITKLVAEIAARAAMVSRDKR